MQQELRPEDFFKQGHTPPSSNASAEASPPPVESPPRKRWWGRRKSPSKELSEYHAEPPSGYHRQFPNPKLKPPSRYLRGLNMKNKIISTVALIIAFLVFFVFPIALAIYYAIKNKIDDKNNK